MAVAKAWEEAKGCRIVEELVAVMVVEKCKAVLATAETAAEEAVGLPAKQKG